MKGGKREGAGRKKGSKQKKTVDLALKAAQEGLTPLEFMLQILRDEEQPHDERKWAAEKAAPFIHARLQATELTGPGGGDINVKLTVRYLDGNNSGPPKEA
jgi:hypothetical protein